MEVLVREGIIGTSVSNGGGEWNWEGRLTEGGRRIEECHSECVFRESKEC